MRLEFYFVINLVNKLSRRILIVFLTLSLIVYREIYIDIKLSVV